MLDITEVNFRMCKYKIDSIVLTIPGMTDYEVKSLGIGDFVIEKDFDKYQYPYFRVIISVPNKIYRAMKKNHNNIQAYVRMVYAYFQTQETIGTPGFTPQESVYLADNFIVVMEESSPHVTVDTEESTEEQVLLDDNITDLQEAT